MQVLSCLNRWMGDQVVPSCVLWMEKDEIKENYLKCLKDTRGGGVILVVIILKTTALRLEPVSYIRQ
jgi:hypothetical protein